eukprot:12403598-Karenia_brevis.AAC.1
MAMVTMMTAVMMMMMMMGASVDGGMPGSVVGRMPGGESRCGRVAVSCGDAAVQCPPCPNFDFHHLGTFPNPAHCAH